MTEHAYSKTTLLSGLAVLRKQYCSNGCVVKPSRCRRKYLEVYRTCKVFDSQRSSLKRRHPRSRVVSGDVVVITHERYEEGGPGMRNALHPTSYIKIRHLGKRILLLMQTGVSAVNFSG